MKNDLNGWIILEKLLTSDSGRRKVTQEIFGGDFDLQSISKGEYLINAEEIAALMDNLEMDAPSRCGLLDVIISNRQLAGNFQDVINLRQLQCTVMADRESEIPCVDLEKLSDFNPEQEDFEQFTDRICSGTVNISMPPGAMAFKVNSAEVARKLDLLQESLIIVDPANPPCPEELSIFMDRSGNMDMGYFKMENSENMLWSFPILRMHLLAGNSSGLIR